MSENLQDDLSQPLLIVISGPSGVGKDSVIQGMKERDQPFHFVVTVTTRPPRPGERRGEDYFFISEAEFFHMVEGGELVERLRSRQTESQDHLALRATLAQQELDRVDEFDYVVVNARGQLDEAVDTILAIICAEHHRVHPRKVSLE